MTEKNIFGRDYTQYWQQAVKTSVDGLPIPTEDDAKFYVERLGLKTINTCLDLGCSDGRMFDVLASVGTRVSGIDIDPFAVEIAAAKGYQDVNVAGAEKLPFPDNFFDLIFAWGVFDTIDLNIALPEVNRASQGWFLFTGKSDTYHEDDVAALRAEKGAFLKGHPNKFTNLETLRDKISGFGFKISHLLVFERRGDFGKRKFLHYTDDDFANLRAYEYLILAEKVSDLAVPEPAPIEWSHFSKTMSDLASRNGFDDCESFLESSAFD